MGYKYNKNRINRKPKNAYNANRVSGEDYTELNANQAQGNEQHFELAEVIDVIRSQDHPDYKTNEDIGKAKVRRIYSEFNQDDSSLGYAQPLDGRFKSYPLQYELVLVAEFNTLPFYIRTANWRSNPNQNAAAQISINKIEDAGSSYSDASAGISDSGGIPEIDMEGDSFEVREDVMPLRHRAGDSVVEGRFGQSIRLGRDSEMNPLLQLRVGQRTETAEGEKTAVSEKEYLTPFFEDINKDPTSIYMTSEDVEFPLGPDSISTELEPATIDFDKHLSSAEDTPDAYNGKQILMATDRIVLNAKGKQIMGFAEQDINWVSLKNFTVDTKKKVKTYSKENVEINTDAKLKTFSKSGTVHESEGDYDVLPDGNIHLTTTSEGEPVARGKQTVDRLRSLLQTLSQETHPTPVGPSGPPTQASTYIQILQEVIQTIESGRVFLDSG
jgi:hypothetical protein